MFDWIPLPYYTSIQYHFLLVIVMLILLHASQFDFKDQTSIAFFNSFGFFFIILFTLYMGLRPISGIYFGDTANYAAVYKLLQEQKIMIIKNDFLFNYLMKFCSQFLTIHQYYLLLDIIYVVPCIIFSRRFFGNYWFFGLFFFICSFSFWSYGTNGLRNGLGTSIFILALSYYDKKITMYSLFAVSYFMHASLIIPTAAFITAGFYKNPKIYIYIWLAAIPLSLLGGSSWASFFSSLGFEEERTAGYLTGGEQFQDQFSQTGFRWDFVLYSASAVFAGWYFIFKKNITDVLYIHLFGIYCITNAFWILVITAAFSNRFAYLSWFLMPAVIAYPMFRFKIWKDQYKTFAVILFAYFMFTYFMNVIK